MFHHNEAYTIKAFQLLSIFIVHDIQTLGTISLGVGVLTDVSTSGALCFYLNRLRTGYQSSDTLINSLCKYAINTGALTSTLSASTLLLYNLSQTNNLYFVATHFILSKLYSISFMTTLNTCREVRGWGTDQQGVTSNNTNLFHLGTRTPSMVVVQLES
ncbi:hypothetical protein BDQ12DRAFT_340045 [Crucibulum laeve]|uniref:DUF6534 domain-containing protein n=1 Tax=Crucibulum laeve TaxID=68775 RepID=A0A5C3LRZ0_9AGAR|nr:hypothetical protein BDQ12DRAFT_340045 [Crucibulum laeve]